MFDTDEKIDKNEEILKHEIKEIWHLAATTLKTITSSHRI
jgi:hypothetical protein